MKNTFTYYPHERLFEIHLGKHGQLGKTLVDAAGFDVACSVNLTWSLNNSGYAVTALNQKTFSLHSLICSGERGVVDHINGNRLDNRSENLRRTTHSKNLQRGQLWSNNKSGFKGVYFRKDSGKWDATINYRYKKYGLGSFFTKEDAARAYNAKALELYGEHAKLNIIP